MKIKISHFVIFLIFASFIFVGIFEFKKIFEGYLNWKNTSQIYEKMLAEIPIDYSFLKPFRNWKVENLEIGAISAFSLAVNSKGEEFVLFSKNAQTHLPIASLTKILSGYVIAQNYDLGEIVTISDKAIKTESDIGFFKEGQSFFVKDLLHSMMMESSNDATMALAEKIGINSFVALMQDEIKKIGLLDSRFVDPIGLDPDSFKDEYNYSSAKDLAFLVKEIIQKSKTDPRIKFFVEITKKGEFDLYTSDNKFHHKIKNTNKLLEKYQDEIIFGKTGNTPMAKECFLLAIKHPKERDGYIINVILGSKNREEDMEKLINWIKSAYIW